MDYSIPALQAAYTAKRKAAEETGVALDVMIEAPRSPENRAEIRKLTALMKAQDKELTQLDAVLQAAELEALRRVVLSLCGPETE